MILSICSTDMPKEIPSYQPKQVEVTLSDASRLRTYASAAYHDARHKLHRIEPTKMFETKLATRVVIDGLTEAKNKVTALAEEFSEVYNGLHDGEDIVIVPVGERYAGNSVYAATTDQEEKPDFTPSHFHIGHRETDIFLGVMFSSKPEEVPDLLQRERNLVTHRSLFDALYEGTPVIISPVK